MKNWILVCGPLIALATGLGLYHNGVSDQIAWTAGITLLTAIWWIFEPVPIPATSLIPLTLLPLTGVLSYSQVSEAYGDKLILLLMGGFILSTAMERSGAHRRIALTMVRTLGGNSPRRLIFGFMCTSVFLSMWISNASTTLMLLPIVLAVVEKTDDMKLRTSLLLGVAYAASLGGICTPIGTPPNLVFISAYQKLTSHEVTFVQWMIWTTPIAVVMIPIAWLWLTRGMSHSHALVLPPVGKWRSEEVRTLGVFAVTALLWITRKEPFGGWSELTGMTGAHDSSVALLAVLAMFLIPNGKGEKLLDWQTAKRIPWGILLLYAAGIAIAKGFTSSGLSELLGQSLKDISAMHIVVMIGLICLGMTFLTEITSNTATTNVMMPVLVSMAVAGAIEPRLIMVPATISASFAFMLPVATPPNAVVFGAGGVTIKTMAREGLALNFVGVVVVTGICYWLFG